MKKPAKRPSRRNGGKAGKVIAFPSHARSNRDSSEPSQGKAAREGKDAHAHAQVASPAQLSRPSVFSFLKDTRGIVSWTTRDLADTLKVSLAQANDALPILEMQGYVKRSGRNEWMTTIAGESVSDSVTPRYRNEAVKQALDELQKRIDDTNADRSADFTVTAAVAFGDFLSDRTRVQAADVGIDWRPHGCSTSTPKEILAKLRARSAMLHLQRYANWMVGRTHRRLM